MNALVDAVFAVFTEVGDWIVTAINQMVPIFYDPTEGLTFMGIMATIGVGLGVILLVVGIIQSFLRLRS